MTLSADGLRKEAGATGFRPEVLEKVHRLLDLLDAIRRHPYLEPRVALKGGTALNLFVFDVPRLSVDIDLNYIGAVERETMRSERPVLERAMEAVAARLDLALERAPEAHAGGKWRLRYASALGQGGTLELDVNYMYRVPLWPVGALDSRAVGSRRLHGIPVLDLHELAGGKLAALLARGASRDLFDTHHLLTRHDLDKEKLRTAFVLYGAMNRRDWRQVSVDDVRFHAREIQNQLIPVLSADTGLERRARATGPSGWWRSVGTPWRWCCHSPARSMSSWTGCWIMERFAGMCWAWTGDCQRWFGNIRP